jgi:pimeloyl-ACP methyl ester carboxylesterase
VAFRVTALIAIPALGCDARLYDPIRPLLPASLDLSVVIADGDSFAACAAQVLAQAPERFVAMGTSFGGRLALELTLAAPERVSGLVVIGAGPGPVADPIAGRRRSERLRSGAAADVVAEMAAIISHLPGPRGAAARDSFSAMSQTQGPALMARQSDALAQRIDLWPRLAEIRCPALMLWGDHDQFSPAADGLRMSAAVAHGRFVELSDCGHLPTLEYPEESAAAISHWLEDWRLT